MTTTTKKETASAVGALDAAAVRDQRFLGAKLLRTTAMQANLQDELPSVISCAAVDNRYDSEDGAAYESLLDTEWRTVMTWLAPRRPRWTTAQARIIASAPSTVEVEWRVLGEQGKELGTYAFPGAGLGTRVTSGSSIDLVPGRAVQRFTLQARGAASTATIPTGTIGSPNSWDRSTNDTFIVPTRVDVENANWVLSEIRSGKYRLVAESVTSELLWTRDILFVARTGGLFFTNSQGIQFEKELTRSEIIAADASGAKFRIVRRPSWAFESFTLIGGSP